MSQFQFQPYLSFWVFVFPFFKWGCTEAGRGRVLVLVEGVVESSMGGGCMAVVGWYLAGVGVDFLSSDTTVSIKSITNL